MASSTDDWSSHFTFLPEGAKIQKFIVGGENIVLGFDDAEDYTNSLAPFFGETIGRVANRIAGGKINNLNGKTVQLAINNGPNSLHGGAAGWGKKHFEGPRQVQRDGRDALHFVYHSADGDEGYPGAVQLNLWYFPSVVKDGSSETVSLEVEYEAQLVGEEVEETAINVCNHSYFNISGNPTIEGTKATLSTNLHQVVDKHSIPTGEIAAYPGIQKNETFVLGSKEPAVDHCFIINNSPETVQLDTRAQPLQKLCELQHEATGIHFEALSTEPAFQFYTGEFLDVPAVKKYPARGPRSGLCIEASRYINAVNVDSWRSMVILKSGQTYGSRTIYRATRS